MGSGKFHAKSIKAAILLAHVALHTGDRVGLFTFSDQVTAMIKPQTGMRQLRRIVDALRSQQPGDIEADYDAAFLRLGQWQKRQSPPGYEAGIAPLIAGVH